MTRVAVQALVTDPIWNTESVAAATPVARFSTPAAASTISPSTRTATWAAGNRCFSTSSASRPGNHAAMSSVRDIAPLSIVGCCETQRGRAAAHQDAPGVALPYVLRHGDHPG